MKIRLGVLAGGNAQSILDELALLPSDVLHFIKWTGIKFVAARDSVADYMPGLHNVQPRGHGSTATWDTVARTYNQTRTPW